MWLMQLGADGRVDPGGRREAVNGSQRKAGRACVMWSVGAPGVYTSTGRAQEPPASEGGPLGLGPLVSSWPMGWCGSRCPH